MEFIEVIKDGVGDLFAELVIDFGIGDEDSHNGNGLDVVGLSCVGIGRDGDLRIEGVFISEGFGVRGVDGQDGYGVLRGDVLNGGGREACGNKGGVDGFILEGIGTLGEGEKLFVEVVIGEGVSLKDLAGISLCARACRADGYAFAFELFNARYAAVLTDNELASFGVEGGDSG